MRDVVFHCSWQSGLTKIEPTAEKIGQGEQQIVFASPSLAFASCFLMDWDDDWCHLFALQNRQIHFSHRDAEKFARQSALPGSIYVMKAADFRHEPALGKDKIEWVARDVCKPLFEIPVPAAIDAMRQLGVSHYAVDDACFRELCRLDDKHKKRRLLRRFSEQM